MYKVISALFLACILGLFLAVGVAVAGSDLLKSDARIAVELAEQQRQARIREAQDAAARPFWYGVLFFCTGVAVFIGIDAYAQRRRPMARADSRGMYPVDRRRLQRGDYDDDVRIATVGYHRARITMAEHQPIADRLTLTVTPDRAVQALSGPHTEPQALPAPALPAGTVDLTTFLTDWRPSIDSILLAVGPGGARYTVHARDLCHVALAGATGGGKSNIMRLLIAQLQAAGARVCLADPHYTPLDMESGDDWRAIAQRLYRAPAVTAAEIGALLDWLAADELPRRLDARRMQQPVGPPLFLAIDELPAITADVKDAHTQMGRILREGRKVNLLLVTSAQDWLVKSVGGTGAVRDNFRTSYYVGGDPTSARVLLDVTGRVDDGQLGAGLAFLRSRATPTAALVRVPLATNGAISGLLPAPRSPDGSPLVATGSTATRAAESGAPPPADAARAARLFLDGKTPAQIVEELRGVKSNQGRSYQTALAEVLDLVRAGVRGEAA